MPSNISPFVMLLCHWGDDDDASFFNTLFQFPQRFSHPFDGSKAFFLQNFCNAFTSLCVSIPLHFSLLRSVTASFLMTSLNFSKIPVPVPCCSRINIQIHPLTLPPSFFQASGARSNNTWQCFSVKLLNSVNGSSRIITEGNTYGLCERGIILKRVVEKYCI